MSAYLIEEADIVPCNIRYSNLFYKPIPYSIKSGLAGSLKQFSLFNKYIIREL